MSAASHAALELVESLVDRGLLDEGGYLTLSNGLQAAHNDPPPEDDSMSDDSGGDAAEEGLAHAPALLGPDTRGRLTRRRGGVRRDPPQRQRRGQRR